MMTGKIQGLPDFIFNPEPYLKLNKLKKPKKNAVPQV